MLTQSQDFHAHGVRAVAVLAGERRGVVHAEVVAELVCIQARQLTAHDPRLGLGSAHRAVTAGIAGILAGQDIHLAGELGQVDARCRGVGLQRVRPAADVAAVARVRDAVRAEHLTGEGQCLLRRLTEQPVHGLPVRVAEHDVADLPSRAVQRRILEVRQQHQRLLVAAQGRGCVEHLAAGLGPGREGGGLGLVEHESPGLQAPGDGDATTPGLLEPCGRGTLELELHASCAPQVPDEIDDLAAPVLEVVCHDGFEFARHRRRAGVVGRRSRRLLGEQAGNQ